MRLFLVRHGETVDNVANLFAGSRDSALTAHGVLQARRLAAHFAERITIKHLFSSNLGRAVHTAEAALDAQKCAKELKLVQLLELREKDFGSGEGLKFGSGVEHEGAETAEAMRKRIDRFLDEHLVPVFHEDTTVCIVSHGIILGVLFKALCARVSSTTVAPNAQPESLSASLVRPTWSNTGYLEAVITTLPENPKSGSDLRRLQMRIDKINNVDHLKGLKKTRGGIGSSKFDAKQKTMDSFFKPTARKRKAEDEAVVSR